MNSRQVMLLALLVFGACGFSLIASEPEPVVTGTPEEIRALRDEVRRLSQRVAELEKRVERLSRDRHRQRPTRRIPDAVSPPGGVDSFRPDHLQKDQGLYVFPGLDAPPLTPMDAIRNRAD